MHHIQVFTDGSVNTQLKIGYAAYLIVTDQNGSIDQLKNSVKIKRFENTSSTKLELQGLLLALEEVVSLNRQGDMLITIYTDSQNIISLPERRVALEQNKYFSSNKKRLNNYELYQEFYRLTAILKCELVKVVGLQVSSKKSHVDRVFTLVDKASRRALREEF